MSGASQVGRDYSHLEGVASGGCFVIFVALQGERRNADVEVGAISPLDAERPPKHKKNNEFNFAKCTKIEYVTRNVMCARLS